MKKGLTAAAVVSLIATGVAWAQQPAGNRPPLTEGNARSMLTSYGCTNISALSPGPGGSWHGMCSKGGQVVSVMVDPEGKAGPATNVSHVTEGNARSALTAFGCSNISTLSRGPEGTWHGRCTKGGQSTEVMVDAQGKASAEPASHITEAHARSALMQFGCSNLSSLNVGMDGNWTGQCSKGGRTVNVMVDPKGVASGK